MPIQLSTPQKKSEPRAAPKLFSGLGRTSKVGTKDRLFFTEQLALLLETGTNLHAGLQSLQTQAKNPALRAIIDQIIVHISEGKTFSYALSCHPEVFSKTYVNLVAASESGGYMHQVLEQLLAMEEKREQLKATMMSALSYPVFLTVFSLAVVVFVLVVVFPKFSELFLRIADQLPATTKFLMAASNVFIHRWYLVLGGVGISVVGIVYLLRTEAGSLWVDRAKLKLPVVRDIFQQMYLSQVLRVMGLSLGNGVNILDSLRACKEIVDNRLFRKLLEDVEERVQEGSGVAYGFQQSKFVPDIVKQMITTGEETGNLPKVMERVADFYERELTKRLTLVSKMAEPIMLLVMGVVVGLIVSSLILPIFKLSRVAG